MRPLASVGNTARAANSTCACGANIHQGMTTRLKAWPIWVLKCPNKLFNKLFKQKSHPPKKNFFSNTKKCKIIAPPAKTKNAAHNYMSGILLFCRWGNYLTESPKSHHRLVYGPLGTFWAKKITWNFVHMLATPLDGWTVTPPKHCATTVWFATLHEDYGINTSHTLCDYCKIPPPSTAVTLFTWFMDKA